MGYSVLTLVVIAWLCMTTRKERRQQRAVDRGFVSSCPKGFRFLAVPSSLYSRVRAQRDALAEHERCNIISGRSHHFLAQAIESAASSRGRSITRRARSLNSRAATKRHNWPSEGSGASSAGSEVDDFSPQVLCLCELIGEPSNLFQLHSCFFNGLYAGSDEEFDDCPSSISSGLTTGVDGEVLGDSLHECGGAASCELATEIDTSEEFSLEDEGIIDTFLQALCFDSDGSDSLASVDSADVSIGVGDTLHASLDGGDSFVGDGGCKALAEDSASQRLLWADVGSSGDSDDDDFVHDEGFQYFSDVGLDGRASSALAGASQGCDLGNLHGSALLHATLDGGDTLDAVGGCKALAEDSASQRLIWADVDSSGDSDDEDFSDIDPDGRASSALAGASLGCVLGKLHGSLHSADNNGWCLVDGIWSKRAGRGQRELTCSPDPTGVPDEDVVDKIMKNTTALAEDSAHVMHDTEEGSLIVASGPLPSALAGASIDVPVLDVTEIADEKALTEGADFVALAEESASSASCNASALTENADVDGSLHEQGFVFRMIDKCDYVECVSSGALQAIVQHSLAQLYRTALLGCRNCVQEQWVAKWKALIYQYKSRLELVTKERDDLSRKLDSLQCSHSLEFADWANGFKNKFAVQLSQLKDEHQNEVDNLKLLNSKLLKKAASVRPQEHVHGHQQNCMLDVQDLLHETCVKPHFLSLNSLHEVLHEVLPVGGHTGITEEAHHSGHEGKGSEKWSKRRNRNRGCRKRCSEFKLVHADNSVVGSSANVDAELQTVDTLKAQDAL